MRCERLARIVRAGRMIPTGTLWKKNAKRAMIWGKGGLVKTDEGDEREGEWVHGEVEGRTSRGYTEDGAEGGTRSPASFMSRCKRVSSSANVASFAPGCTKATRSNPGRICGKRMRKEACKRRRTRLRTTADLETLTPTTTAMRVTAFPFFTNFKRKRGFETPRPLRKRRSKEDLWMRRYFFASIELRKKRVFPPLFLFTFSI